MAERPDEYELDDYPERHKEDIETPSRNSSEEKFFQENSLRGENYKKFRIRQQMIESNRVNVRKSFLKGSQSEVKILKRNILSSILDIPYDEVDETKFDLMVEPVDIETFKLYYGKNRILLEYNSKDDRITILSRENLNTFKVKYTNETTKRYVEKEMKTDFSIKSDISALDLEVRQSESEEYHRKINSLEREISYLKQFENDSIEKSRRIEYLEDRLKQNRIDADNQYEGIREKLKIKSIELLDAQNEIADLNLNISKLESDKLELETNIGVKNIDISSLQNKLDGFKEDRDRRVKFYEDKLSGLEHDRDFLKKYLESDIESKQNSIKSLVEQKDKAQKEIENLIDFQGSLQSKIIELEYSLGIFETNLDAEKTINESKERELNDARDKINELEESIILNMNLKNSEIDVHEKRIKFLETLNESNERDIESRKLIIQNLIETNENLIKENETEIGGLRFERETLQNTVAQLNREIERSDNINEVLTTQLDRVNNEIIELNGRIENHQAENQALTIELDSLRSNFGNLVAAAETTNRNNTLEIGRLNIKIRELEDNDDINEQVDELLKSVDNYKHLLEDAVEDKKKLKKEFEEEFDKLNKEKESLVQDLKNKSKNEDDLKKKLFQNENSYSLLVQKYEKSFSKIDGLMTELNKSRDREKILETELEQRKSRIKVKDNEVTEKMAENEKLKKQMEDANLNIRNSDFFKQQFEQKKKELEEKTIEYNKLVQLSNRQDIDKDELTEEIRILQQEIADVRVEKEQAQSKILPPETIEQMKHDIRNLNKRLDDKDKKLKEDRKKIRDLEGDKKNVSDNFNRYKETITRRMERMKEHYEKELENQRKKLTKTINPGELKALNVFLEDLDIEDYDKVDYDTQIKKLRSAREKFKRLIDDPNTDRAHRLPYKYLDDLMQYRIDFLNIEFKKPIETTKGRDYLIRTDSSWSPLGMVRRILLAIKDNPGTTMSLTLTAVSNLAFGIFYLVSTSENYSKKLIVNSTKSIVKATRISSSKSIEPSKTIKPSVKPSKTVKPSKSKSESWDFIFYSFIYSIPAYALSFAKGAINLIDWFVENFYKLILAGVITSVTLYNKYGEEMSFPIISFWSFVFACAIVFATILVNILPSWLVG